VNEDELESRLETARYGRSRELLEETRSTNDDARARAEEGAPDGHLIVALRQSGGRGSHGRRWVSPPGGLYFSLVLRPRLTARALPTLTLAAGLAVAEAVERSAPAAAPAQIKWPNDVILSRRKCAGILVESATTANTLDHAVVGIGINVGRVELGDELREIATSVPEVSREALLADVLSLLETRVASLQSGGPEALVGALESRLAHRGKRVRVGDVVGLVEGISPSGALRISTDAGVVEVVAGSLEALDE
jgi:BirA family biotin operon repressor/biotin-[acetyl-CoA-carboxylase] ligase